MPVKEKDEVLTKDIKSDLDSIRSVIRTSGSVFELGSYDFEKLCEIYKNQQQQITFMRKIYSEIIQEILEFISLGYTTEAMINLCILDRVFDGQQGGVDIETGLDCIETINQYIHKISKNRGKDDASEETPADYIIQSGMDSWNNLKIKRAIHVCITPFLDDNQNLVSIEQELEAISEALGR